MASSTSPITFSGSSTYASDFQQVITRAVSLASLPMQALQNDVTTLQAQQSALSSLDSTFISLQTAIGDVSSAVSGSPSVSTGGSTAVSASAAATALPGTYTIQVNNLGSSTTTLSKAGLTTVADPSSANLSTSTQFTLTVNGAAHTINSSGNTMSALVTAINGAGDGVQATIVNVGSTSSPDYRLALSGTDLAPDTIQLNDGTKDLLDTLSTGANAQYTVSGQPTAISSSSDIVTLSPGLTVTLLQQTSSPVSVTVSQTYSGLQSALSNVATAFNAAVDALAQHRGQSGGALSGDQIVYSLTGLLENFSTYTTDPGSVSSLADLGLTLDSTGHLTFDATAYSAANTTAIQQFLGSTSSGGFLKTVNDQLQTMTDTTSGILQTDSNTLQDQIKTENSQIVDEQTKVTDLQTNLQSQLSAADAAIATLQSQTSYFQQLFTATYGNGTNTTAG
jgi:flagellar hook-associated protein 2